MLSYPLNQLLEEVAFLAYYFHWDHETIMNMEHRDRQLWCKEVSKINKNLNSNSNEKSILDM
ncbi:hypothetical protein RE474_13565 [Methanolobus sediminis]|uniref:DUF6760 domain-containing protein n=1 Tax=Methanolobus sediminis TaxID=3072978 RepID=A0AA51YJ03_9EURY|nr:DUF6760 family protein [Methanolobus sediminis]WMW25091.1 hypothetical protein RE474_13565 [Methanolobus sediminis]